MPAEVPPAAIGCRGAQICGEALTSRDAQLSEDLLFYAKGGFEADCNSRLYQMHLAATIRGVTPIPACSFDGEALWKAAGESHEQCDFALSCADKLAGLVDPAAANSPDLSALEEKAKAARTSGFEGEVQCSSLLDVAAEASMATGVSYAALPKPCMGLTSMEEQQQPL